ncbi:MAG: hypothetical protein P1U86_15040 [Verrucomicrobiales bacterium]|nr:hypothetical protein [Verrucomicrobiales bacterium]
MNILFGSEMKLICTISILLILVAASAAKDSESIADTGNWIYVDFIQKSVTYRYLGKTSKGHFRFKRVGGTVEPWTPEITLEPGKVSPDGLLRVIRQIDGAVEVQVTPKDKPEALEPDAKTTASTIFVGFHPRKADAGTRPIFVEVSKPFRFGQKDSEFIVSHADSDTVTVNRPSEDKAQSITFTRHPRPQQPNKAE